MPALWYHLCFFSYIVSIASSLHQYDFRSTVKQAFEQQACSGSSLTARDSLPAGYVAAPYYPAPKGGWVSSWSAADAKAQLVVFNMTLAEKVNLTTGKRLSNGPLFREYRLCSLIWHSKSMLTGLCIGCCDY